MKRNCLVLFSFAMLAFMCDADARIGGEGRSDGSGGNRGGGGKGQGPSISRTPSMSRSVRTQQRPAQRPSPAGQNLNRSRPEVAKFSSLPVKRVNPQSNLQSREQARNYLRQSKPQQFNKETLKQRQNEYRANRGDRDHQNKQNAKRVRDQFRNNHHDRNDWFNNSFYDHHHYHPNYYNPRVNWWRAASWAGVSSWLAWGWGTPIYYETDGYPVYLNGDDGDYSQSDLYAPYYNNLSQEYGQTVVPAAAPAASPNQDVEGDWLPLGVYAVGQNESQAAVSNMFVQLAVRKNGDIAGTYYNSAIDQTHELEGVVDQDSQQAVWKISDNPNSPIMSTGIYNLTQDETNVLVHFPNGTEQTWLLVRLEE